MNALFQLRALIAPALPAIADQRFFNRTFQALFGFLRVGFAARRLRDANAETSALARDMCEKLLARNLTQQDDARLLDDLLQKAGDSNGK